MIASNQPQGRKNYVRPVVQIVGSLRPDDEGTASTAQKAIGLTLNWLKRKQKISLPSIAYEGESFDIDASENFPVSAIKHENYWALQFDKFDKEVPGRVWRSEVTVAYSDESVLGGIKLTVLDLSKDLEFRPSVPAVIQEWIENLTFYECGAPLKLVAIWANTDEEIDRLGDLLRDPDRTRPVVLFAGNKTIEHDANNAAKRLAGLAHVYIIHESKTKRIASRFGKEFSLWSKSVRTYMPGFNPATDEVASHPFTTIARIAKIFGGTRKFIDILVKEFSALTFKHHTNDFPSFRSVKQEIVSLQLSKISSDGKKTEREDLLEKENIILKQKIQEKTDEFEYADSEEKLMRAERDIYKSQNIALRERIRKFEIELKNKPHKFEPPKDFSTIDTWVMDNYPDRMMLLNRAARAAKKSPYNNPLLVYQCLDRLARQYVDSKRNGSSLDNIFDDLGVSLERTGDPNHLSQWRDQYFVSFGGQKMFLEWHLKKGYDHSDTTTLRIYFFYDEENEQVVICHLTSHLTNSMT